MGLDGLYVDDVFVGGEELSFYAKDTEDAWGMTNLQRKFHTGGWKYDIICNVGMGLILLKGDRDEKIYLLFNAFSGFNELIRMGE